MDFLVNNKVNYKLLFCFVPRMAALHFFSQFGDKVTAFFLVVQVFVKKNIGEWRLMSVKVGEWFGKVSAITN